ncbi:UNVERIFIED_CONTAM: beta-mannosidase [Williamsia faeni]
MLTDCRLIATVPDEFADVTALSLAPDVPALAVEWRGLVTRHPCWSDLLLAVGDSVDDADWWLTGRHDNTSATRLRFAGLTFPATVYVDGSAVAEVESMFLPVDVSLTPGPHEIAICFRSLSQWLTKRRGRGRWRSNLVAEQKLRWARTTLLGRAPVYGGSPAPVGLWRTTEVIAGLCLDDVDVQCDVADSRVRISGRCTDAGGTPAAGREISCGISRDDTIITTARTRTAPDGSFTATIDVVAPELWWPRGYGSQTLYELDLHVAETRIHRRRIGFRSIDIDPATAPIGFGLMVNGVPVFCRGAVWMPADSADVDASTDAIRHHLRLLADAGANMVRIPGGTVYEKPEFWSTCAELGILVWQDTMLATFDPPTELNDVVAAELQEVLRAIGGNPSLAVVSGGNETLQQPEMLGLPTLSRNIDLIEHRLRTIAAAARIPYVPSSPSAPPHSPGLAIRPSSGVAHWFGVGGYLQPLSSVANAHVRFAAESLAFSIPSIPAAVEQHFGSSAAAGHDPRWKSGVPRDKGASWDFEDVRDHYVREIFAVDPMQVRRTDPDRYLQLGRMAVIAAMNHCFAFWRRRDSECRGALVLSAKDLVAGPGWGLIDVDGNAKATLSAIHRIWSPVTIILSNEGLDGVRVDIFNDNSTSLSARLELTATDSAGRVVVDGHTEMVIPERSSTTMHDSEITGVFRDLAHAYRFGPAGADAVQVTMTTEQGSPIARDALVIKPVSAPARTELRASASADEKGSWYLEVIADAALRWVEIDIPGWRPADNYFHLAPGLPYRVSLKGTSATAPSGRVSSVDSTTVAKVAVAG